VPALMYSVRELHYGKLTPYSRGVEKPRVAHFSLFCIVYGTRKLFTASSHVLAIINKRVVSLVYIKQRIRQTHKDLRDMKQMRP
jgi:hypothetical protein